MANRKPIPVAELDKQVVELKRNGASFRAIAAEVDKSVAYVYKRYQHAIADARAAAIHTTEQYLAEQLARLQASRERLEEIIHANTPVVSNGHIVSEIVGEKDNGDPIYGDPLHDDGPAMAAIRELRQLDDQEAKLLGLYAAVKVDTDVTVNYTVGAQVDPEALT